MSLLIVHVAADEADAASDWLWSLGATAIEERPDTGELIAGFSDADQALAVRSVIEERWPTRFEEPPEESAWRDVWLAHLEPVTIGHLVVHPPWREPDPDADQMTLSIDPGRAFGSGHHASTQLAILALIDILGTESSGGSTLLDVGCGTGVLSVVGAALGSRSVLGIDLDLDVAELARSNAVANGYDEPEVRFSTESVDQLDASFDVAVANMTWGTVAPLLPAIHERCDHRLVLSGLLRPQVDVVSEVLTSAPLQTWTSGDWIAGAWAAPAP